MTSAKIMVLIILSAPFLLFLLSGCQATQHIPATPAVVAQPVLRCAPATDVILFLKRKYNEEPLYTGVFGSSIVLTIFVSPSRSFTVVHTGVTNEMSCLVSSGRNFKEIKWGEKKSV